MYCPSLKVIHKHSHTLNRELSFKQMKIYYRDSYIYYLKEYRSDINKILQSLIILGVKWQVNWYWTIIRFIKKVIKRRSFSE